jgi:hypothetical protein
VQCVIVANGSLELAARAERLQTFLFDKATKDTATEFAVQRQMNRPRGERFIRRWMATEHCDCFVTCVRIYRWRAATTKATVGALLSLARCLNSEQKVSVCRSREPASRATSTLRKPSARCAARPHQHFRITRPRAKGGSGVRYARPHDCQRASRKPSAHAVVLCSPCARHVPHCTAKSLRAEAAAYATLARVPTHIT